MRKLRIIGLITLHFSKETSPISLSRWVVVQQEDSNSVKMGVDYLFQPYNHNEVSG